MKGLAIVGGSSLFGSKIFEGWDNVEVKTPYGIVMLLKRDETLFLQRHGIERLPPHMVNHRANIFALKSMGVKGIVAILSVGSLKKTIRPGTFLVPDDFFCPWRIPTFFDDTCKFTIPKLDVELIELIFKVAKNSGLRVKKGGTYVQTLGPRFETVSEINFFRRVGHVVGMTMASEATLASEAEIPYAGLCSVDNFCHGIGERDLTISEVEETQRRNLLKIEDFIKCLLDGV